VTAASPSTGVAERLARLTPREREVLDRVVEGRLNKQIGGDLGVAEKTIKVRCARSPSSCASWSRARP